MQINQPDDNCSQPILLTIFNRNAYRVESRLTGSHILTNRSERGYYKILPTIATQTGNYSEKIKHKNFQKYTENNKNQTSKISN